MKKKNLQILILLTVLVLIVAFIAYKGLLKQDRGQQKKNESEISQNQDREDDGGYKNISILSQSGEEVKISDLMDKPLVLNMWASWCNPCRMEMPFFNEAYKKYSDKVNFAMVNITGANSETKEDAENFIKQKAYEFPIYFDIGLSLSNALNASAVPVSFFFKDGKIIDQHIGYMEEDLLEEKIQKLTGGN